MKIPPELDELMWRLAEAGDDRMIEAFGESHPDHRDEMLRRFRMVRDLKQSRPRPASERRFDPSGRRKTFRIGPLPALAAAAVLVSLGGVAAFFLQRAWSSAPVERSGVVSTPQGRMLEQQSWYGDAASDRPAAEGVTVPAPPPARIDDSVRTVYIPPFERRISIDVTDVPLSMVLQAIAVKAGVRLQAAPGMPELNIEAKYENMSTRDVLADLGRSFGFTPLEQTHNEALLIPAVDATGAGTSAEAPGSALPAAPTMAGPIQRTR
ncbi:MAG: hypothetical protein MH204_11255 [Fimbriimonadaceae bacterium]|nr:hypothetical protein [Fimbriimonadaceae bacterium]